MCHLWIQMRRWLVRTRFVRTRVYLIQHREGHFLNWGKVRVGRPRETFGLGRTSAGKGRGRGLSAPLVRTHKKREFRKWPSSEDRTCKYVKTNPSSPQYRPPFYRHRALGGDLPCPSPMGQAVCRKKGGVVLYVRYKVSVRVKRPYYVRGYLFSRSSVLD